jgi:hypothetical protein
MKDLRAAVLSIEWEISDATLSPFLEKLNLLADDYSKDSVAQYFIKILNYLGKYIKSQKSDCDPKAIRELNKVFEEFEKVMPASRWPEAERKEILFKAFQRFKGLKRQLLIKKDGDPELKKQGAGQKTNSFHASPMKAMDCTQLINQTQLREAIDEIKAFLKDELEDLRQVLLKHT